MGAQQPGAAGSRGRAALVLGPLTGKHELATAGMGKPGGCDEEQGQPGNEGTEPWAPEHPSSLRRPRPAGILHLPVGPSVVREMWDSCLLSSFQFADGLARGRPSKPRTAFSAPSTGPHVHNAFQAHQPGGACHIPLLTDSAPDRTGNLGEHAVSSESPSSAALLPTLPLALAVLRQVLLCTRALPGILAPCLLSNDLLSASPSLSFFSDLWGQTQSKYLT